MENNWIWREKTVEECLQELVFTFMHTSKYACLSGQIYAITPVVMPCGEHYSTPREAPPGYLLGLMSDGQVCWEREVCRVCELG